MYEFGHLVFIPKTVDGLGIFFVSCLNLHPFAVLVL